ncbi:MAG: type II toxin-antitoxin system VapC family toxin [Prosthecobacter sp.]|nr:type II toxin-antitoxin system VapC family toxin [Prosthecobacter sp.]
MLVLDTNHLRCLAQHEAATLPLLSRLKESEGVIVSTIVTAEEHLRGWLARIRSTQDGTQQVPFYSALGATLEFYHAWVLLPWDAESAGIFKGFRRQGIRIGTQDLKIACITIAHDATLLTRNTVDFAQVPGLRFENWLD